MVAQNFTEVGSEEMSTIAEQVINLTEERFKQVAPASINYDAEKGFALQLLMNNDYLMKVAVDNKASLAQAVTNVAAIGLSLNPAAKQAYLLPRTFKEGGKYVSKIFLEPSYVGLCKLATDCGAIEWVQARCVYDKDTFTDNGVGDKPTHEYNAFSKERGDFVGVYCVAKTVTGDYLTSLMDAAQIGSVMERSETVKKYREKNNSGFGGPWITDFEEMAKKTVVRNAFKMWPRSTGMERLDQAVHLSNENEGFEPIQTSPNIADFTGEQKEYYDQLIEKTESLEMYVFLSTVDESVRNNLYHSFKRGEKGKYQQVVDALYRNGASTFTDCADAINDASYANDDAGVMEIVDDMSLDAMELMKPRLSQAALAIISENSEEEA